MATKKRRDKKGRFLKGKAPRKKSAGKKKAKRKSSRKSREKNPSMMVINEGKAPMKPKRKKAKKKAAAKKTTTRKRSRKPTVKKTTRRRRRSRNPAQAIRFNGKSLAAAGAGGAVGGVLGEALGNKFEEMYPAQASPTSVAAVKAAVPAAIAFGAHKMKKPAVAIGAATVAVVRLVFAGLEMLGQHFPEQMQAIGLGAADKVTRDRFGRVFVRTPTGQTTLAGWNYAGSGRYLEQAPATVSFANPQTGQTMMGKYLGRYSSPQLGQVADVVRVPAARGQMPGIWFLGAVQANDVLLTKLGAVQRTSPYLGAVQQASPDLRRSATTRVSDELYLAATRSPLAGVSPYRYGLNDPFSNISDVGVSGCY